jgi:hypothetical protein
VAGSTFAEHATWIDAWVIGGSSPVLPIFMLMDRTTTFSVKT